jgi:hypothetical protein
MVHKAICVAVACLGFYFAVPHKAGADAMVCSGEEQACIAKCPKYTNPSVSSSCVTNCHARRSMCMQTGCWDNGRSRYCGLGRR